MLGGIMNAINGAVFGTINAGLQIWNMRQQQQNFEANTRRQEEAQLYDRGLQNIMLAREDMAAQRRAADLRAAGLSPVLAAGQSANAGPVIHSETPQSQRAQIPDIIPQIMSILKMKEDISNTVAQRDLINLQKTESMSRTLNNLANNDKITADTRNSNASSAIKEHDYSIYKATGTTSNSGSLVKDLRNIWGAGQSPAIKGVMGEILDKISNDFKNNQEGYKARQKQREAKK